MIESEISDYNSKNGENSSEHEGFPGKRKGRSAHNGVQKGRRLCTVQSHRVLLRLDDQRAVLQVICLTFPIKK